jgi:hypothetical protein
MSECPRGHMTWGPRLRGAAHTTLVERLREGAPSADRSRMAADRIETLEAALRHIEAETTDEWAKRSARATLKEDSHE